MGNKMKKLLCALLASAMLITSAGTAVFADADKPEDDNDTAVTDTVDTADTSDEADPTEAPEETQAPEATAAPEVTEAPVVSTGTAYDNDTYYQKALSLCSSLGIISGYEDGSVRPDANVTRAQMASIVLRMLALNSTSTYQGSFTDLDASHWAADQIQTALEQGIVNGMGDGTFRPDDQVTYAQVTVMLVNALNYTIDAEYNGGWPNGYMTVAQTSALDLLNSAPGSNDVASERGTVIKMVYNALLAQYKEITNYWNNAPVYEVTIDEDGNRTTLAKAKFNVKQAQGLLMGTAKTSLTGSDLQTGEIEIVNEDDSKTYKFETTLTNLEDYLGQKITYYYKDNTGLAPSVLAVTYDPAKTESYTIEPKNIVEVKGFDSGSGEIKVDGTSRTRKFEDSVIIVYNGKPLSDADKTALGIGLNDLMKPEVGSLKLVDSNKNDRYDVLFVDSYETMVITSASEEKVIGKIQDSAQAVGITKGMTINLDDSINRVVTVTRNGNEVKARNLKKNDVASVRRSLDDSVVDIVVTGESITGSVSGMSIKMDKTYATINGTRYDVANVAVGNLKTGAQCTFYFDAFDRIGYIEGSGSGRLGAGEKYGWLMDTYEDTATGETIVKIMTQNGKAEEYKIANSVDYWAPNASVGDSNAGVTKTKREMETIVEDIINNKGFYTLYNISRDTGGNVWLKPDGSATSTSKSSDRDDSWKNTGARPQKFTKSDTEIRLVKYKTDSNNKLTRLYFAVGAGNIAESKYYKGSADFDKGWLISDDEANALTEHYLTADEISVLKSSSAVLFDPANMSGKVLSGGLLGGYSLTDDAIEFDVPDDPSKYADEELYNVANVVSSRYNVRENGVGDTYFMAEADGRTPAVLIKFIADAKNPVEPGKLDNVGNTPAMIVDTIDLAINDDDEKIYVINGYSNGVETSVTTKRTSALAELLRYAGDNRSYETGDVLWKGTDDGKNLADVLHQGDIIVTDGTYILLYASAEDVYDKVKANASISKYVTGSETRNYFWFDAVTDSDVDTVSWMSIGSSMLSADATMSMDVVEIDLSRDKSSAIKILPSESTIADVQNYSDGEGDYAFARFASKGALQEVILFRIKK